MFCFSFVSRAWNEIVVCTQRFCVSPYRSCVLRSNKEDLLFCFIYLPHVVYQGGFLQYQY